MFRRLWITRINAAARAHGLSYNQFISGLKARRASSSTARCSPTSPSAIRPRSASSPSRRRPRSKSRSSLITSRDNEKLKLVRKLHERRWRDKLGLFVARGRIWSRRRPRREPVELLVAGRERRAGAAGGGLDCGAPAARDRRLPARRPAAPELRPVTLALWRRRGPGERRHADPHGRCVRGRRRALGGLRRPDRPEGAARRSIGRALPRAVPRASTEAPGASGSRSSRTAASRSRGGPLRRVVFVLGAEREGLPDGGLERDLEATIPRRRGGVAERRDGGRDRALRVAAPERLTLRPTLGVFRAHLESVTPQWCVGLRCSIASARRAGGALSSLLVQSGLPPLALPPSS